MVLVNLKAIITSYQGKNIKSQISLCFITCNIKNIWAIVTCIIKKIFLFPFNLLALDSESFIGSASSGSGSSNCGLFSFIWNKNIKIKSFTQWSVYGCHNAIDYTPILFTLPSRRQKLKTLGSQLMLVT